jgi:hypothetical protein
MGDLTANGFLWESSGCLFSYFVRFNGIPSHCKSYMWLIVVWAAEVELKVGLKEPCSFKEVQKKKLNLKIC